MLSLNSTEYARFATLDSTSHDITHTILLYSGLHHHQISIRQLKAEFLTKVGYLSSNKEKKTTFICCTRNTSCDTWTEMWSRMACASFIAFSCNLLHCFWTTEWALQHEWNPTLNFQFIIKFLLLFVFWISANITFSYDITISLPCRVLIQTREGFHRKTDQKCDCHLQEWNGFG